MRLPRGLWFTFGAFCVLVAMVSAGYVAATGDGNGDANRAGATGTEEELPAAVDELPQRPGTAYQVPDAAAGITVPATGSGRFVTASGGSAPVGSGRMYRYTVVVEDGTGVPPAEFAAAVEATLADPRGWAATGRWGFQRVGSGAHDVTVHLATPGTTDEVCGRAGVRTRGEVSCRSGGTIVINLKRWLLGVPHYGDALPEYRHMVVNHEVGHFLGHGHVRCGRPGGQAPIMQQQTLGLDGCVRNAWPFPDGHTYVTGPAAGE